MLICQRIRVHQIKWRNGAWWKAPTLLRFEWCLVPLIRDLLEAKKFLVGESSFRSSPDLQFALILSKHAGGITCSAVIYKPMKPSMRKNIFFSFFSLAYLISHRFSAKWLTMLHPCKNCRSQSETKNKSVQNIKKLE